MHATMGIRGGNPQRIVICYLRPLDQGSESLVDVFAPDGAPRLDPSGGVMVQFFEPAGSATAHGEGRSVGKDECNWDAAGG
ncbi:MAG: hypothetical protein AAGF45_02505 [Pseudomonadota bacterium]